MKVLVIGATGGSGRAAVNALIARGHEVTAFVRRPCELGSAVLFVGDALNANDLERAVRGHDAVVVTLGISENPLRVRLFGPTRTPLDVRSRGTQRVIEAMKKVGVTKLVVQTSYGVADTRTRLGFVDRMFFKLLIAPQIQDTELQTTYVKESALDWVIAQPVHLTDASEETEPFLSLEGETQKGSVSRRSVGRFLADAVTNEALVHRTVALSGAHAA